MRAGAFDFVVKPVRPERLEVSVRNALKVTALEGEITRIKKSANGTLTFSDIITSSKPMERVLSLGRRASKSNIPILIEGESGVGKELIARAIQGSSDRRNKPLVTVNCGAIPENLVESVLFGHEKGAFTGAIDRHVGKFQEADGGTLFLDEVGELPLDVQVRLLRAIQEGEIEPVGAKRPSKVDFRLISATNRSLIEEVKRGNFREDLYYRLNVFPIWVPPLRERRDDIPELVRHFIARFAAEEGKRGLTSIAPDALALLQSFDWPGNIRQLENAVFRAVVLSDNAYLTVNEFPQIAAQMGGVALDEPSVATDGTGAVSLSDSNELEIPLMAGQPADPAFRNDAPPFGFMRALDNAGHVRTLEDVEREMIRNAIDHYSGRMAEVARRLGIGRSTLYRKLKEYGLDANPGPIAAE